MLIVPFSDTPDTIASALNCTLFSVPNGMRWADFERQPLLIVDARGGEAEIFSVLD